MPIEFRCASCSKLLRTPDESAGKKARCPQCGAIVDVPLESQPDGEPAAALAPHVPTSENPFGEAKDVSSTGVDPSNPYATSFVEPPTPTAGRSLQALRPSAISFDAVFRHSWLLLRENLAVCLLMGLIYVALAIVVNMVLGAMRGIGQSIESVELIVAGFVVEQVGGLLVNTFLQLGALRFGLRLVRTGRTEIADFFAVGNCYLRGLGLYLLMNLIYIGLAAVCLLPALITLGITREPTVAIIVALICAIPATVLSAYATFRMYLAPTFLIDYDLGILDSLRQSDHFMTGNKLTAFVIAIVVGLGSVLFIMVNWCVGVVVVSP